MKEEERLKAELKELQKKRKGMENIKTQQQNISKLKKEIVIEKAKQSKIGRVLGYLGEKGKKMLQPPSPQQAKKMAIAQNKLDELGSLGLPQPTKKKKEKGIYGIDYI